MLFRFGVSNESNNDFIFHINDLLATIKVSCMCTIYENIKRSDVIVNYTFENILWLKHQISLVSGFFLILKIFFNFLEKNQPILGIPEYWILIKWLICFSKPQNLILSKRNLIFCVYYSAVSSIFFFWKKNEVKYSIVDQTFALP